MAQVAAEIRSFLIADVRGYTAFTVERGDEAAARLAEAFAALVERAVAPLGGEVLELRGDEALVVFASARQAVRAAVALQAAAEEHNREHPQMPMRIGAGIDAGEAVPVLGGFRGQALNLAARLCSLAGPGEVLVSEALAHLAGRLADAAYEARGSVQLKGFSDPVDVVALAPVAAAARPAVEVAAEAAPAIGVHLGALPSGLLVARDPEARRVRDLVDAVGPGAGRALLITGEPGAGKTRLAQEAQLRLRDRGFAIATGGCLETRQSVPYYPFLDILPRLVDRFRALGGGEPAAWPYLQMLVAGARDARDAANAEEERVRRDVAGFVAALARRVPVAILVDDLHWADTASIELFHHLVRQLSSEAAFVLGTYRDIEVRHEQPLERMLRALRRDELAELMAVKRLDAGGTAALVAACFGEESVSAEFGDLIHRQTDGNPFFVQQVLKTLVERGDVYREGAAWERRELSEIEVPESIRSAIGERMARLPESARDALSAASVLGQTFDFDDLAELSGLGESDLEGALDAAGAAGLVRAGRGDSFSFEHAVAQQTLLGELSGRRRRRLHEAAAELTARRAEIHPALAGAVAYHYAAADRSAEAAAWNLRAGQHAVELVALAEAETHFRAAVELAEDAGAEAAALDARYHLGLVCGRRGRLDEAVRILDEVASERARRGEPVEAGRARWRALHYVRLTGRAAEARDRADAALKGELDTESRAWIMAERARASFGVGDYDQQLVDATAARAFAAEAGVLDAEVTATGGVALALGGLGRHQEALALHRAAIEKGDGRVDAYAMSLIHNNYAFALWEAGDFAGHMRERRVALALSEQYAQPGPVAFGHAMVAQAHEVLGEMEPALAAIEAARPHLVYAGENAWRGYVDAQEAVILFDLDRHVESEALMRRALADARHRADRQLGSWVAGELAMQLTVNGRAAEARELLTEELALTTAVYRHRVLGPLVLAERALGNHVEAVAGGREALESGRAAGFPPDSYRAVLAVAGALRATGELGEAAALLEPAVVALDAMPYPAYAAWARAELAAVRRQAGDAAAADVLLAEAEELIERHGIPGIRRLVALAAGAG